MKALSLVASVGSGSPQASRDRRLKALCDAVVHSDESRHHAVIAQMIAAGVPSIDIADVYVPLAARKLGEAWVDDELSFSQVTIGATRLQETVRALGRKDAGASFTVPLGHRILLVIPTDEDHTMGAFVAASQFRRHGLWVHLAIGQSADEIARLAASQHFEMIGISGAGRRAVDPVREVVSKVRTACPRCPPVVVGGNVCNLEDQLLDYTGADFVTTSPGRAMGFCGLTRGIKSAIAEADVCRI